MKKTLRNPFWKLRKHADKTGAPESGVIWLAPLPPPVSLFVFSCPLLFLFAEGATMAVYAVTRNLRGTRPAMCSGHCESMGANVPRQETVDAGI